MKLQTMFASVLLMEIGPLMQDYKRNAYMESDLRCSSAILSMEKRLRAACHASDSNIDNVVKVSTHFLVLKHVKCLEEKIIFGIMFYN